MFYQCLWFRRFDQEDTVLMMLDRFDDVAIFKIAQQKLFVTL